MLETSDLLGAMKVLKGRQAIVDVAVFGSGLHIKVSDQARAIEEIRSALSGAGIKIGELEPIPPSMEDVFVGLIEEQERLVAR
jgi:ABC-2 type transport system ATP-binding protein